MKYNLPILVWKGLRKWLCQSVIPFIPLNSLRIWGYRLIGFKIGKNVFIGMRCYLDDSHPERMIIENNVNVSYQVSIATHGPRFAGEPLILRKGCYVGMRACLLGGLEIGEYATVGAAALVNKSVPPMTTVVGVPARPVSSGRVPYS